MLAAVVAAVVLVEPPAEVLVALEVQVAEVLVVHIALQAQEQRVLLIAVVAVVAAVVMVVAEHLWAVLVALVL
jgi:hypothetical protein